MSDGQVPHILERMVHRAEAAPVAVPLTASRAVRLAVTRAADRAIGLVLNVQGVSEETLELDGVLTQLDDAAVMLELADTNGARGVLACDYGLSAAAGEVQMLGKVAPNAPDPRPVTSADLALLRPFLDRLLSELLETTPHTALDGWADGVRIGSRFDTARGVGFSLSDLTYRMIRLKLDLGGTERQGDLIVALPMAADADVLRPDDKPAVAWAPHFQAAVLAAPARLDAVLHRFDLPLAVATRLAVGQTLALRGCSVQTVRLEDLDGQVVARGRLGQIAGQIAVRIETPDAPHLEDLDDPRKISVVPTPLQDPPDDADLHTAPAPVPADVTD